MFIPLLLAIVLVAVASYLSPQVEKAVRCFAYAAIAVYVIRELVR